MAIPAEHRPARQDFTVGAELDAADALLADEFDNVVGARHAGIVGFGLEAREAQRQLATEQIGLGADFVRRRFLRLQVIDPRSEEHTSELQSLMRISYAVFCLKK